MLILSSVGSAESMAEIAKLKQSLRKREGARARLKAGFAAEKDIINTELAGEFCQHVKSCFFFDVIVLMQFWPAE